MEKNERKITPDKAYTMMARICSQKECAPIDMVKKLQRLNLTEPEINKIIDRLRKENYLDEIRYIRSYIHDKLFFNKWGRRKIALFLQQKQLSQHSIEKVLAEFSDTSFGELLPPLLEKKWKSVKGNSDYEKKGKLIRYAMGRGFSMDEIMACIRKMEIGELFDEME